MQDDVRLIRAPVLERESGVVHGFTTRQGGVSAGERASLNLAVRGGDDADTVTENWRRACRVLGVDIEQVAILHQVHGAEVVRVTRARGPLEPVGTADAAVTTEPGVLLAVRTADCVPVLLAAPGAVGVVHSGWRGTALDVVGAAVRALCDAAGCEAVDVSAAVGPRIGVDAYEVGEEVVSGLTSAGIPPAIAVRRDLGPRPHVDLGAAVAWQLRQAGLVQVDLVGDCTATSPDLFSHRADGPGTGRLAGLIARRP